MRVTAIAVLMWVLALTTGCGSASDKIGAEVLLFDGTGTSLEDVKAIEEILRQRGIHYTRLDSRSLDALSLTALKSHRLLIMPGGNFERMGNHLGSATSTNIRTAVHEGLNYLGICAGAFIAGDSPYNGINLTDGVRFGFYSASARGIRKAVVPISMPNSPLQDHYWEDGPQLDGWGTSTARYPDGTSAVSQGRVGRGWVVLSGIHPEAPETWREGMIFNTPAQVGRAYAVTLIESALTGTPLPPH